MFAYADHNDNKYDGEIGDLRRKQIVIGDIEHIGKESNNLEESEIIGVQEDDNVIYDDKVTGKNVLKHGKNSVKNKEIIRIIMQMTQLQLAKARISKRQLIRWRKRLRNREMIMFRRKKIRKLMLL